MDLFTSLVSDSLISVFGGCLPSSLIINVNNKSFRVLKLLGEGGFSTVYLVRDMESGNLYAVKKIFCAKSDPEAFQVAFREVEINKLFVHNNIAKVLDVCVDNQEDGSRIVYIFFDYYQNGSLQDLIENNTKNNTNLDEKKIIEYFLPICDAIKQMHSYQLPIIPNSNSPQDELNSTMDVSVLIQSSEESSNKKDTFIPYAHRDIKPGNIMLNNKNQPILMDFGSAEKARISCKTRQQALAEQEKAAKYSTMTYRAPELFDVEVGQQIDESVDIWSLGCLLYALAYGYSPFDFSATEAGGSTAIAVMNGKYTIPAGNKYSDEFVKLISYLLNTENKSRANINEVIEKVQAHLSRL
ncbi:putative serine/threonine-protein kinase [Neoconidiobolus thromboides FSU 785]|nr:putative serine/threonine-protein kinase [Neoconidiobolus thromboides FSU 785]